MLSPSFRTFPKELGIDKYIDYDLQFEKSFLEELSILPRKIYKFKTILDSIGWKVEKTVKYKD